MELPELTELLVYADGQTEPEVPSGTAIILVQEGMVKVGKLIFVMDDDFGLRIDHPTNEETLNPLALTIIQEHLPETLQQEDATVLTCPESILMKMEW